MDEDLARFPYVNGDLFRDPLRIPSFAAVMRGSLLDACRFDWSNISPAIFGALFQSVMDPKERRAQGAHYTTEKNILKVIEPLFMDDLRAEFARLRARKDSRRLSELRRFQDRLGAMRYFDPACGCGNFLIIAYRELRLLEIEVIREIRAATGAVGQDELDVRVLSQVDVDQFYGIEISEFPARIAETALWMMDHIMNNRLGLEFGQTYARIPLQTSPHILYGDALETDWTELLPPQDCAFVFGNPPFIGQSFQSKEQREQMRRLTNPRGKTGSPLDYVGGWFLKAATYATGMARIGFVATNSLTQGEQVALLWPRLFASGLEIAFAHRTFAWGSDARGKAHVHVVIIGLDRRGGERLDKRLFSYPDLNGEPEESRHAALSPYLFDAGGLADPRLIVRDSSRPLSPRSVMQRGVQPTDGGHFIFSDRERQDFLDEEPSAGNFFRPFIGAREHINGLSRWILFLEGAEPEKLRTMPLSIERIRRVRAMRLASRKAATVRLASTPTRLEGRSIPTAPFLVIPETSSERREYVPIGWLKPPVIPSNLVRVVENATRADFALLTSAMHMAWLRHVGGRLKSDYRYSIGLVYNAFPIPPEGADLLKLEPLAQTVLDARTVHPGATLADLYDPDLMPPNLRRAHQALDRAVDRLYRPGGFAAERQRVEHLFMLYEKMGAPLEAARKAKSKGRRAGRSPAGLARGRNAGPRK